MLVGSSLALIAYFVVRAGFLSGTNGTSVTDAYGVAALSGLAGLFSREITQRLETMLGSVLGTRAGSGPQGSGSDSRALVLQSLNPTSVPAHQAASVQATGRGFKTGMRVRVGSIEKPTNVRNGENLVFALTASEVGTARAAKVCVFDPASPELTTQPVTLTITETTATSGPPGGADGGSQGTFAPG